MTRFTLALALLLHSNLVYSYQAGANDALMASFVAVAGEEDNEDANVLKAGSVGGELRDEFLGWAKEFEKEYSTIEEMAERMLVWVENHALIEEHNNQEPAPSYTLGHNHFSDMTQAEFHQMYSLGEFAQEFDANKANAQKKFGKSTSGEVTEQRMLRSKKKSLPDSVNWVDYGAVTPIKDQGKCGGCWSFSTTGAIEGARFIKTGELEPLSEQMLIDCDTKRDNGCNGGLMDNAFNYDEHIAGLCSEDDYAYEAADATCRSDDCEAVPDTELKAYVDVDDQDLDALMSAVAITPVSVAIQADQIMFQFYKKGVFSQASCGEPKWKTCEDSEEEECCDEDNKYGKHCFPGVDHAVLVVGYGTDEVTNKPYWLVKNSWGTTWGDQGYIRMSREVDTNPWGMCGIMAMSSYPILK